MTQTAQSALDRTGKMKRTAKGNWSLHRVIIDVVYIKSFKDKPYNTIRILACPFFIFQNFPEVKLEQRNLNSLQ